MTRLAKKGRSIGVGGALFMRRLPRTERAKHQLRGLAGERRRLAQLPQASRAFRSCRVCEPLFHMSSLELKKVRRVCEIPLSERA